MLRRLTLFTVVSVLIAAMTPFEVPASARQSATATRQGKKFRATRAVVVDRQTGQARLPDEQELQQLVAQLDTLTARPEGLAPVASTTGTLVLDLAGGYAGVLLARPDGQGGFETRCVFTFDEGAEFLGLLAEPQ